jgi:hypothetical protein
VEVSDDAVVFYGSIATRHGHDCITASTSAPDATLAVRHPQPVNLELLEFRTVGHEERDDLRRGSGESPAAGRFTVVA